MNGFEYEKINSKIITTIDKESPNYNVYFSPPYLSSKQTSSFNVSLKKQNISTFKNINNNNTNNSMSEKKFKKKLVKILKVYKMNQCQNQPLINNIKNKKEKFEKLNSKKYNLLKDINKELKYYKIYFLHWRKKCKLSEEKKKIVKDRNIRINTVIFKAKAPKKSKSNVTSKIINRKALRLNFDKKNNQLNHSPNINLRKEEEEKNTPKLTKNQILDEENNSLNILSNDKIGSNHQSNQEHKFMHIASNFSPISEKFNEKSDTHIKEKNEQKEEEKKYVNILTNAPIKESNQIMQNNNIEKGKDNILLKKFDFSNEIDEIRIKKNIFDKEYYKNNDNDMVNIDKINNINELNDNAEGIFHNNQEYDDDQENEINLNELKKYNTNESDEINNQEQNESNEQINEQNEDELYYEEDENFEEYDENFIRNEIIGAIEENELEELDYSNDEENMKLNEKNEKK
jgi:hypothetical protein